MPAGHVCPTMANDRSTNYQYFCGPNPKSLPRSPAPVTGAAAGRALQPLAEGRPQPPNAPEHADPAGILGTPVRGQHARGDLAERPPLAVVQLETEPVLGRQPPE